MADKREQPERIKRQPEIEQPNVREINEETPHPGTAMVENHAEQLRYKNADSIYE
ncbi:hypothetical protein [Alteribacillus bidgolensis]|uniref:Uncharacterized protein n=1 Tax=Alteribacillus bidgolensis TaxID=930129 RepID=A0A1G8JBM6_9BACI|nr:hypothetical protein [Alteribacillus bidgolensis]SDI28668.1 hypothetical protein SAMN05216352_106138 [Alteribacillus bidgolensis]